MRRVSHHCQKMKARCVEPYNFGLWTGYWWVRSGAPLPPAPSWFLFCLLCGWRLWTNEWGYAARRCKLIRFMHTIFKRETSNIKICQCQCLSKSSSILCANEIFGYKFRHNKYTYLFKHYISNRICSMSRQKEISWKKTKEKKNVFSWRSAV